MLCSVLSLDTASAHRDLARRARHLADSLLDPADQGRLERYAMELEAEAERLERDQTAPRMPVARPAANEPFATD